MPAHTQSTLPHRRIEVALLNSLTPFKQNIHNTFKNPLPLSTSQQPFGSFLSCWHACPRSEHCATRCGPHIGFSFACMKGVRHSDVSLSPHIHRHWFPCHLAVLKWSLRRMSSLKHLVGAVTCTKNVRRGWRCWMWRRGWWNWSQQHRMFNLQNELEETYESLTKCTQLGRCMDGLLFMSLAFATAMFSSYVNKTSNVLLNVLWFWILIILCDADK